MSGQYSRLAALEQMMCKPVYVYIIYNWFYLCGYIIDVSDSD